MTMSSKAPARSVVVAGDVTIDWNLTVDRDVTVTARSTRAARGHAVRQFRARFQFTRDVVRLERLAAAVREEFCRTREATG